MSKTFFRARNKKKMICRFSVRRTLIDGTLMNLLITLVVYGSIYFNPYFWISDYPADIQAAAGQADIPLEQQLVVGALLSCIVVGIPLFSNAKLRRQNNGVLTFPAAFIHSASLLFFFALWDLLIHDWLIFVTIQPAFVVIPGTEGLAGYKDYWFHFEESFLGWAQWVSISIGGLVFAGLAMFRRRKRTPPRESSPNGLKQTTMAGTMLKKRRKPK